MAKTYTVKQGDTIQDTAFNVAGSLAGIDPILEKNTPTTYPPVDWKSIEYRDDVPERNFMESYTPSLRTDQILDVEGVNVDNLEATQGIPFNSSFDNQFGTDLEIERISDRLEFDGRKVISSIAPATGGFRIYLNKIIPNTFYNTPYTVQIIFYVPSKEEMLRIGYGGTNRSVFDTNGSSYYPRIDIYNIPGEVNGDYILGVLAGGYAIASPPVLYNVTYNFLFVYDGEGTLKTYLNGDIFRISKYRWAHYTSDLTLGVFLNESIDTFTNVNIRAARWFNRAITTDEIAALYNDGSPEDYIVPGDMKINCVAEYLPQNIIPTEGDPNIGALWLDSSAQMPIGNKYLPLLEESIGGRDLYAIDTPKLTRTPLYSDRIRNIAVNGENGGSFTLQYYNNERQLSFLSNPYTIQVFLKFPTVIPTNSAQYIPLNLSWDAIAPRFIFERTQARIYVSNVITLVPLDMYDIYSITLVNDGQTIKIYNGSELINEVEYKAPVSKTFGVMISSYPSVPFDYTSDIYGIRIFARPFAQSEVDVLWNGKRPQEFVVPSAMKQECIYEYLPQNIVSKLDNPEYGSVWFSSHKIMPNAEGILEPMQFPSATSTVTNLVATNNPKIIKL